MWLEEQNKLKYQNVYFCSILTELEQLYENTFIE